MSKQNYPQRIFQNSPICSRNLALTPVVFEIYPFFWARHIFGKETQLRADFEAAVSTDESDKLGSIYRILEVRVSLSGEEEKTLQVVRT